MYLTQKQIVDWLFHSDYVTMTQAVSQPKHSSSQPSNSEPSIICLARESGRPLIHANSFKLRAWQTSSQPAGLSIISPELPHTDQSAVIKVRQTSTVSKSVSHLRVVQQVRSSLSLGRYQTPTRSWCSPSTGRSELSDMSAKPTSEGFSSNILFSHPSQGFALDTKQWFMSNRILLFSCGFYPHCDSRWLYACCISDWFAGCI